MLTNKSMQYNISISFNCESWSSWTFALFSLNQSCMEKYIKTNLQDLPPKETNFVSHLHIHVWDFVN